MKNDNIEDERILSERRLIQSKGYGWIITILMTSVIVQLFFMRAPFEQYAVEFFIIIGCGLYNIIANYNRGIDIWNPRGDSTKTIFKNTLISGFISLFMFVILSGNRQLDNWVYYLVAFIVCTFIFRLVMVGLINKKQEHMDKELNDDDTTE